MMTDQVNIEVISPDIPFGICLQFNPEDILLAECIDRIVIPADYEADPYWKTPVGHNFAVSRQLVCGQFVRQFLDKNFSFWKMPHYWSKEVKQIFNCQAEVVGQIWRLVKLLPASQKPRPLFFESIISDYALVLCGSFLEEEQEITATEWVKKQQAINRKLHTRDNPFDPKTELGTWRFIEQARKEAQRNPSFSKDYAELVRARMAMITILKQAYPKIIDQAGEAKEKRGRKKKELVSVPIPCDSLKSTLRKAYTTYFFSEQNTGNCDFLKLAVKPSRGNSDDQHANPNKETRHFHPRL